ncbi:MAG TPA: methylated-DNA--[protein]-cysteine S-methyltransferase [Candidatus Manganitrophaceae bacterium]|nr:methylated-DNA--[protein]-cysteine S-methyltransferase [Candidatus Manganitrophaceae bacterium]
MESQHEFFYDFFPSPLGPLWMVSNREGLCFILREESQPAFLAGIAACAGFIPRRDSTRFGRWRQLFTGYFSGKRVLFDEPISWTVGTSFQKKIWNQMRKIPHGELRSYRWIADELKMGAAARAVGNACGKNPLPIVVPCHRVVRHDGSLGGYTGGIGIKKKLLAIEGAPVPPS